MEIEGQRFEDAVRVAETPLVLNGVGVRAVLWIRGFAAGLYLRHAATDPARVLEDAGPKRVELKMLMKVPNAELVKALVNGVRKNTSAAEQAQMAARLNQMQGQLAAMGDLRKGDTLDIDWRPAQGLVLLLNGQSRGAPIAGADLYRATLKIFIGERAIDKRLRAGLLAGAASAPGQD